MEQLTKNQAVATSQEAVQNQNEPQLRDENAHNDKSVHGVLNPTYQAGLRRDAVQPDIEAERKKRDEIEAGKSYCSRRFGGATCDDKSAQIYARFDKIGRASSPWMPDRTEANPNELNQDDARYGFRCCHLKNIWTAPLPPETELSRQMTTSTTSIDIMGLQAAYANLHTDQERDYFMQRYHDVISSFGGKTSYDADNRPLLVMRSNLWASGYDVDGTDQTSLGQFSGRVQQTYKHSVPRFFVPEHGTMFTLALVRF